MESGIDFLYESFSATISEEYSAEIYYDTTQTYSYDIAAEFTIPCTAKSEKGGVGLCQYVSETNNGDAKVLTTHTVCRYGDLYNVAPACPWNACANSDCSECRTDWKATSN